MVSHPSDKASPNLDLFLDTILALSHSLIVSSCFYVFSDVLRRQILTVNVVVVEFQEIEKYGRSAGIDLGGVDFVKYAEAFGAKGLRASCSADMESVMREALQYQGVCIVDIVIDYSQNHDLMTNVVADSIA